MSRGRLVRLARHYSASSVKMNPPVTSRHRTYDDAIDALNTLQTPFAALQARHKAGIKPDASFVHEMKVCLSRIGYAPSDLDRLNVVHVAGTKGKGSTCALVDSIFRRHRQVHGTPARVGLFTSPHLIAVRERIRINSQPISKELFTQYFFDVWDRLAAENHAVNATDDPVVPGTRPTYARFLTLVSWHLFLQEGVDLAIYEVGIGGEFDATNLVEQPVASGITSLGIDHIFALGDTLEKISWHKAGIMKTGSPAFTVQQLPKAAAVLRSRAEEKNVELTTLDIDPRLRDVKVKPDTDFQRRNASLAVALAETALKKIGALEEQDSTRLSDTFVEGIEATVLRGRCEVIREGNIKWCLDGAHTADSMRVATRWFLDETRDSSPGPRILVFNQQGRTEALDFLDSIHATSSSSPFTHVIFTTNNSLRAADAQSSRRELLNHQFDPATLQSMTVQRGFAQRWAAVDAGGAEVLLAPSVEETIELIRGPSLAGGLTSSQEAQVFVTGSLHLVGAFLGMLESVDAL